MDGFYGSGIVVLPVPPDQELSDRLPSPNSWSRWGILRPSTWEGNMIMDDGNVSTNSGACGARLDILQDDRHFDLYLDLLDKYRPSYKNMSHVNEETVDDFFYRDSLMADLHSAEKEQKHEPFCFCSQSDSDVFPAADSWLDIGSSPGLSNYAEKLVNLEEQSLLARDPNDGGCETPMVPLNMKDYQLRQDSPSSNDTIVPSGQFGPCFQAISETSPEEVALEELKMVMTQLSDRTRICFRDALYRLADNSKQRPKRSDGQERGTSIRKPLSWADERSSKEANESKTNVIDRTIANMVFNRMDSNLQEDHSESAPADLDLANLCACGAPCSCSNLQLVCQDDNELQFSHEFEVPVLGRRDG